MTTPPRRWFILFVVAGFFCGVSSSARAQNATPAPAAGALQAAQLADAAAPLVDHVIHISVDGLSGLILQDYLDSSPETFPTFVRLTKESAYTFNARTDYTHTITLPNHTAMLTGRPVTPPEGQPDTVAHLWVDNTDPRPGQFLHNNHPHVDYIASTFDVAHDAGLLTRHFANKSKFSLFSTSYDAVNGADDKNPVGGDNGKNKIDQNEIQTSLGAIIGPFVAAIHATPADRRSYSFLHFADPDTAGHATGWGGPQWRESVIAVDGYLDQILAEIGSNPVLAGKTAVIVTADHGGFGRNHGQADDPRCYTIPIFVWGVPGLAGGQDVYQVFAGITDPGEGRPDFNAPNQPLRNGSTGNLSMMLLGLDPIPGSSIFVHPKLAAAVAQRR